MASSKKSSSILELVLHRWPAPPPRARKVAARWRRGRQGDHPCWCVLQQDMESLVAPAMGFSSWIWPLTSLWRVTRQKEIVPMGINKVSHYHLNVADCIFVSLHFSLQTFRLKCVIRPCHGKSPVPERSADPNVKWQRNNRLCCTPPTSLFLYQHWNSNLSQRDSFFLFRFTSTSSVASLQHSDIQP